MMPKHVCIVGAGISGLVTARTLLARGHSVTVFEKTADIGGVWNPIHHYPGLRTQSPRDSYAFSDLPMPDTYSEFPDASQVHAYLHSYAKQYELSSHIQLNTAVIAITRRTDGKPGWQVSVSPPSGGDETTESFDFVVVCNGVFSKPLIPEIPGRTEFESGGGTMLHSSQLHDTGPLRARDVVVVGFGKSALDIAETAMGVARRCSIVCHRTLWKVPRYLWGVVNAKHFILSRFAEFWLPHDDMRGLRRFLHERLPRLVDLYWSVSEIGIGFELGLHSRQLRPQLRLRESVGTCFGLAPSDNFRALRSGRMPLHKGHIAAATRDGLVLEDGTAISAQTVILATGFVQDCEFLEPSDREAMFGTAGVPRLYRMLVCPDIPDMAFNGYNGGGASQLTAEIGARWIGAMLAGNLKLPDRTDMDREIDRDLSLRRRLIGTPRGLGYYAAPFMFAYLDRLLRDMALPPADSGKSGWRRYFTAIDPRDYRASRTED